MAKPAAGSGLRIAVAIKQIPRFEVMELTADGRLKRDGVDLEMNAYCRRAVSKGVEIAAGTGGRCTVFTLGPEPAADVLREALACGADAGVLITDPAFAGSDTLATARALAAALRREGPFDLVLVGRNSIDADTGQVGPEIAELMDLPFLCGVREMTLDGRRVDARLEHDDGWVTASCGLPAVLSVAERLCAPAKAAPEARAAVSAGRIRRLAAADLGPGPWGFDGSPTRVGEVRVMEIARDRMVLTGSVREQVHKAVMMLTARGALTARAGRNAGAVPEARGAQGAAVGVVLEPGRPRLGQELCGAAAGLARDIGGRVTALMQEPLAAATIGSWGADEGIVLGGVRAEEDMATGVVAWALKTAPWAILGPSTAWGREVAARAAARLGAGLTGDAIDLEARDGRLVAWKPAFGGKLVAAITANSPIQMATVRAGALPLLEPRAATASLDSVTIEPLGRVDIHERAREDVADGLAAADCVIGVGTGVAPEAYGRLEPLTRLLGAELAATRKVTDRGWMPRTRQVGLTGRSIAPRLYLALCISGRFTHVVGIRRAGTVVAVNGDPEAEIFGFADIGIVGDWREVVPLLVDELSRALAA